MTCAITQVLLRQRVSEAFAARNPNQLAALMVWDGYGKAEASARIQSFGRLMEGLPISIEGGHDDDIPTIEVRTTSAVDDGAQATHFAVLYRSGCFWLRP